MDNGGGGEGESKGRDEKTEEGGQGREYLRTGDLGFLYQGVSQLGSAASVAMGLDSRICLAILSDWHRRIHDHDLRLGSDSCPCPRVGRGAGAVCVRSHQGPDHPAWAEPLPPGHRAERREDRTRAKTGQ